LFEGNKNQLERKCKGVYEFKEVIDINEVINLRPNFKEEIMESSEKMYLKKRRA
jgi:hypothetical protein